MIDNLGGMTMELEQKDEEIDELELEFFYSLSKYFKICFAKA